MTSTAQKARLLEGAMADLPPYVPANGEPTYTLDRQIARARQEMGEDRWQQLQAEWGAPTRDVRAALTTPALNGAEMGESQ